MNTSLARWRTPIAGKAVAPRCSAASSRTDRTGVRWHDPDRQDRRGHQTFSGPGLVPTFARTRLLALENTLGRSRVTRSSTSLTPPRLRAARDSMFTDGARAFNAAVASELSIAELLAPFDSASLCISKGLGAPVGAVLVGSLRSLSGQRAGGKCSAVACVSPGYLTAACIYALEHRFERLADDHANAARLAAGLGEVSALTVTA